MAAETTTPGKTLLAATQKHALPQSNIVLLGTVIKPDEASALVRINRRRPRKVMKGDRVGTSTVAAIESGVLHLARSGQVRRLTVPGS